MQLQQQMYVLVDGRLASGSRDTHQALLGGGTDVWVCACAVCCRSESIRTGFMLSQGGEFAFVLLSLACQVSSSSRVHAHAACCRHLHSYPTGLAHCSSLHLCTADLASPAAALHQASHLLVQPVDKPCPGLQGPAVLTSQPTNHWSEP